MDFDTDSRAYVHTFIDSIIDTDNEFELSTYILLDKYQIEENTNNEKE